jgi:DNA-binding NtrC family response regulator
MKILIIEDERAIRTLLKQAFELWGHEVITAEDGQVGLDAIGLHDPDVVFADLIMPELTGLDVLKKARAQGFMKPVVMVTGSASVLDVQNVKALGAYAVILKPFKLDQLEEILKQIEAGAPPPSPPPRV